MYIKDCAHCALPALNGGICPVFRTKPKDKDKSCPMFKFTVENCEVCGQSIITKTIIDIGEKGELHYLCEECSKKTGTCFTCKMREECEFETNPSTIPKVIQQRIQQGPMTSIIQVKNPTRIEMFCKNCKCFDEVLGCLKENNCCGRWDSCYINSSELQEINKENCNE